jgi:hypothetical protein
MEITAVCLVDRRRNALCRALRNARITVIETFTTDQTVALCVSNRIDAVVLDQEFFVEVDGWSVAQSVKLVKPSICVLLATRAKFLTNNSPKGVDAIVSHRDIKGVISRLREMTGNAVKEAAG